MRVATIANHADSFIPYNKRNERTIIYTKPEASGGTLKKELKYPPKPRATVEAPIIPLNITSHPIMNASLLPKALRVYSCSALAFGNMEESSA